MNNYEFWEELGKIFNAVVAYQEKSVEFNKRFINPWIRLGNVFDKQDRSTEAVCAYQKAIELDPQNAQNWFELGNTYFQMESFEAAVEAYNKAIELAPGSGWSYNNLGLTLATQGKYEEAIPLYQKSIDLLMDDKDKAIAWNRLGNTYRKLNQYEQAVEAFQNADELDEENAGFCDQLDDDEADGPVLIEGATPASSIPSEPGNDLATEAIPAEDQLETVPAADPPIDEKPPEQVPSLSDVSEAAVEGLDDTVPFTTENAGTDSPDPTSDVAVEILPTTDLADGTVPDLSQATESISADIADTSDAAELEQEDVDEESQADVKPESTEVASLPEIANEQTLTIIVLNTTEIHSDSQSVNDTATESSKIETAIISNNSEGSLETENSLVVEIERDSLTIELEPAVEIPEVEIDPEADSEDELEPQTDSLEVPAEAEQPVSQELQPIGETVEPSESELADNAVPAHAAYEEFLKDNGEDLDSLSRESEETLDDDEEQSVSKELVAKIDASGEIQIEVDTNNARVWNELGNVYYNSGAFDDAIVAYSKAIELDRQFAWPYSNLALTYVQKERFVEAILLYQRSIELFSSNKDRAISWNRLGNVYRRLNDYDNAISAYQQADQLDPDNTTLSQRSRFSLLGNYYLDSKSSYVA